MLYEIRIRSEGETVEDLKGVSFEEMIAAIQKHKTDEKRIAIFIYAPYIEKRVKK